MKIETCCSVALLVLPSLLAACHASNGPPGDERSRPTTDPDVTCPGDPAPGYPVAVGGEWWTETFFRGPLGAESFALSHVPLDPPDGLLQLRLQYVGDGARGYDWSLVERSCPATVRFDELLPLAKDDQLPSIEINAGGGFNQPITRVHLPLGPRQITVRANAQRVPDPDGDEPGRWYVYFEPAAGNARMALQPVDSDDDLVLKGLPTEPGTVGLVRTTVFDVRDDSVIVGPNASHADLWLHASALFVGYARTGTDASSVSVDPVFLRSPTFLFPELGPMVVPDGDESVFMVIGGRSEHQEQLTVPCGSELGLTVLGWGEATASIGGRETPLEQGTEAIVDTDCSEESGELLLTIRSHNGRAPFIRIVQRKVGR